MQIRDNLSYKLTIGIFIICIFNILNPEIFYIFPYGQALSMSPIIIILFLIPTTILFLLYSTTLIPKYAKIAFFLSICCWTYLLLPRLAFLSFEFYRNFISLSTMIIAISFSSIIFSRKNKMSPPIEFKLNLQMDYSYWLSLGLFTDCAILFILKFLFQGFYMNTFVFFVIFEIFLLSSAILFLHYSIKKIPNYAAIGFIISIPVWTYMFLFTFSNRLYFFENVIKFCLIIVGIIFGSIIFSHSRKIIPIFESGQKSIAPIHEKKLYIEIFTSKYFIISLYIIGATLIIIPQLPLLIMINRAWSIKKFIQDFSEIIISFGQLSGILLYSLLGEGLNQLIDQFSNLIRITFIPTIIGIILVSIGLFLQVLRKRKMRLIVIET